MKTFCVRNRNNVFFFIEATCARDAAIHYFTHNKPEDWDFYHCTVFESTKKNLYCLNCDKNKAHNLGIREEIVHLECTACHILTTIDRKTVQSLNDLLEKLP